VSYLISVVRILAGHAMLEMVPWKVKTLSCIDRIIHY